MTTDRLFRYRGRLVSAPPELVWAAQAVPLGSGGMALSATAGVFIGLIAGLLGAGALYLMFGARQPALGETVRVIPKDGPSYLGGWGGTDPYDNFKIAGRQGVGTVDPDELDVIGPVRYRPLPGRPGMAEEVIDLSRGWATAEALQQFRAAHSREGYRRRRKGK